jgi:predicted ATPase
VIQSTQQQQGTARMVVLTGAAGTGKSALMRHVLGGLAATGCNPRVVVAQSSALMKDCAPLYTARAAEL